MFFKQLFLFFGMDSGFSEVKERLRYFYASVSPKTWLFAALGIVCFFLIVLFGAVGLLAGIIIILAFVGLLVLKKSVSSLEEKRQFLLSANKEAEKRFLKHLLDEETYRKILSANERRLIEIDAELKARDSFPKLSEKETKGLDSHSRHRLKALLDEKRKAVSEFELAKTKFYKHRIDEKTFQEIASEKQSKIVEVDTLIADLYRLEAKAIMQAAEKKLKTFDFLDSSAKQPSSSAPADSSVSRRKRYSRK